MRTRHRTSTFGAFPLYVHEERLVDERMLALAKMRATSFFRQHEERYQQVFRQYAVRKYRCKPSAVRFDRTAVTERRIREAQLMPLDDCYGMTDGVHITVSSTMPMGFDQLVGTLVHEALHCFCRARGRWMSTNAEHHCMEVLGESC